MIEHNIRKIKNEIKKKGRKNSFSKVKVIGVTKGRSSDEINRAINLGFDEIAENRVQELLGKLPYVNPKKVHFVGHLQRNKVKKIIDKVDLIQSLDSIALAKEINLRAKEVNRVMPCLIQVNLSGEEQKTGLPLYLLHDFLIEVSSLNNIMIIGLMIIAPYSDNSNKSRIYFRMGRVLFDYLKREVFSSNVKMKYLSMGMSGDYRVAISEGANMVRLGREIFD